MTGGVQQRRLKKKNLYTAEKDRVVKHTQNVSVIVLPVVRVPGRERRLLETMQIAIGEFITDLSQGLPPPPRV